MTFILALIFLIDSADSVPRLRAEAAENETFCVECCSMYCGAFLTLEVSGHLVPQGSNAYGSAELADGKGDTAWVVTHGPGEWFEFTFQPDGFHPDVPVKNDRLGVDRLYLWNGYNKSRERWQAHSRVLELLLTVDGTPTAIVELADNDRSQLVFLPKTLLQRGMRFRFTILTVVPGSRFNETAVSEVRLDGYGHH